MHPPFFDEGETSLGSRSKGIKNTRRQARRASPKGELYAADSPARNLRIQRHDAIRGDRAGRYRIEAAATWTAGRAVCRTWPFKGAVYRERSIGARMMKSGQFPFGPGSGARLTDHG